MEFERLEIPAGGRSKAVLTVDLKGKHGKQYFEATILTDEPGTPPLRFLLAGDVIVSTIGKLPYDLGVFRSGERIDKIVHLAKNGFDSAELLEADLQRGRGLAAAIDNAPGDELRVRLTGAAPRETGPFQLALHLRARNGSWGEATLKLHGMVARRWTGPDDIYVGFVPPGDSTRKEVEIAETGRPTPYGVKATANCDVAGLAATWEMVSPGLARVVIQARHPGAAGAHDGTVELSITSAESKVPEILRLPVHVYYE